MLHLRFISAVLNETSIQRASKLEGITKSNPQSLANLDVEVLLAAGDQPEAEEHGGADGAEVDATLTSYTLCYMHTGQLDAKGERRHAERCGGFCLSQIFCLFLNIN